MNAAAGHTLAPLVAEVLGALVNQAGQISLPSKVQAGFEPRLQAVAKAEREPLVVDFVAAALKLRRVGGTAANSAILSLCELAAVLVGRVNVEAAFHRQGLPTSAHQHSIGNTTKLSAPVAKEVPEVREAKPKRGLR